MKLNCWEFKKCGRHTGGARVAELGACPVCTTACANGMNGGTNGGRICWAIAGTLCGGKVQGTFAEKIINCLECDFYKLVQADEGAAILSARALAAR